jgi:hypothetical protein
VATGEASAAPAECPAKRGSLANRAASDSVERAGPVAPGALASEPLVREEQAGELDSPASLDKAADGVKNTGHREMTHLLTLLYGNAVRTSVTIIGFLALTSVLGCSGGETPAGNQAIRAGEQVESTSDGAASSIKYQLVAYDQVAQTVGGHEGKVVVLDLWATW